MDAQGYDKNGLASIQCHLSPRATKALSYIANDPKTTAVRRIIWRLRIGFLSAQSQNETSFSTFYSRFHNLQKPTVDFLVSR